MGYGIPDMCLANDFLIETTALAEVNELKVVLFPNPTKDFLTIIGLTNGEQLEIKLISSIGKIVKHNASKIAQGMSIIDLRELNSGVYFIEMIVDGSLYGVEKINVQR